MITIEELEKRSPCLIKFTNFKTGKEFISIVDYHQFGDLRDVPIEKKTINYRMYC